MQKSKEETVESVVSRSQANDRTAVGKKHNRTIKLASSKALCKYQTDAAFPEKCWKPDQLTGSVLENPG